MLERYRIFQVLELRVSRDSHRLLMVIEVDGWRFCIAIEESKQKMWP